MCEILFRGKRKDNGEWVEGFLIGRYDPTQKENIIKSAFIDNGTCFYAPKKVIPETIGQYTGLTDKNGTKIFEGDIVKHHRTLWGADNSDVGTIQWCQKTCKFYRTSKFDTVHIVEIWEDTSEEYEVIGNIHDNPELLKGGAE